MTWSSSGSFRSPTNQASNQAFNHLAHPPTTNLCPVSVLVKKSTACSLTVPSQHTNQPRSQTTNQPPTHNLTSQHRRDHHHPTTLPTAGATCCSPCSRRCGRPSNSPGFGSAAGTPQPPSDAISPPTGFVFCPFPLSETGGH